MSNVISLPAQAVFDTPRSIAGMNFDLTNINGTLHFSTEQAMQLLGINEPRAFRHHEAAVEAEELSSGGTPFPHCFTVYEIPVFYPPRADGTGGGGTKPTHFHHPKKCFKIAPRTRSTPHKALTMEWLFNLGNEVIQHGFAIDQHAAQNDPLVIPKLIASTPALNFTPLRQRAANKSHEINWVFDHCVDAHYSDGSINKAALSHFRRCVYNTTYLAVLGMTALQVRYTRANPNAIDFGLLNFRNHLPGINCIKTSLNYFYDDELLQNNGFMDLGFAAILGYIRVNGPLTRMQALSMYYHKLATLSEFIKTPEVPWWECPVTAVDTIINIPPTTVLRAGLQLMLLTYLELLPKWKTLSAEEIDRLRTAQTFITDAAIENIDDNGDPI